MEPLVTRFAPSPTGRLHLGHAFSALTAYSAAKASGGRFLLRIEDIDHQRCRPAFEQALYEDLTWLGLTWETPVRRQSEHGADYAKALDALRARDLIYRCFRTRKEVLDDIARAPHPIGRGPHRPFRSGPLGQDEERRRLERNDSFAWRLSMTKARAQLGRRWSSLEFSELGSAPPDGSGAQAIRRPVNPDEADDAILARKDLGVSYHLASVIDDGLQGVTHVIRGEDLRDAIKVQRVLQALLKLRAPTYQHHPLILGADGRRLAKRAGSKSLSDLRNEGIDPVKVRRDLGFFFP